MSGSIAPMYDGLGKKGHTKLYPKIVEMIGRLCDFGELGVMS